MRTFRYQALDHLGKAHKGVIEGDSARAVRTLLKARGLFVRELTETRSKKGKSFALFLSKYRLSHKAKTMMTRQLSDLVEAGLPIEEALKAASDDHGRSYRQQLLLDIRNKLLEGLSLAQALADFPQHFDPMFRASIQAAETSGRLDEVLSRLADYQEARQAAKNKVQMALVYPGFLFVLSILTVIGLLVYVLPTIVTVFEANNSQLPALTAWLLLVSDFLRAWGWLLIAVLVGLWLTAKRILRQKHMAMAWHRFLMRVPLAGELIKTQATEEIMSTLAMLSSSGVPLLDSIRITERGVGMNPYQQALQLAAKDVEEGRSLTDSFKKSGIFPVVALYLIASGERSGVLPKMLQRVAKHEGDRLESRIQTLMALVGPTVVLLLGGVVLMIVLAILLPIFELNQLVVL